MKVTSEYKVKTFILPYLSVGKRGFKSKLDLVQVFLLILHRLKTGCQWREIYLNDYFNSDEVSWQSIYYYFNKWSRDGSFERSWINLLSNHKHLLDLSTAQLDGSHTPSKRGGEAVGYQGRKSCKTSNCLIISDNNGLPISIGEPQDGKHNDLFDINQIFGKMVDMLEESSVNLEGVFMNADPGFDSQSFKQKCSEINIEINIKPNTRGAKTNTDAYEYFDEELYDKNRYKVEQSNAWMDGFKGVIIRYEKLKKNWWSMLWLCITAIFLRKIKV